MSILDKAKDLLNKGAKAYKEYEAKAPERQKQELNKLKFENQKLNLQAKNQSLKDKIRAKNKERYNSMFGSMDSPRKLSIGMEPEKKKLKVPQKKKKQIIINI